MQQPSFQWDGIGMMLPFPAVKKSENTKNKNYLPSKILIQTEQYFPKKRPRSGEKREIENIENFLPNLKTNPIIADKKGLETKSHCELESAFGFGKKYKCIIPIEEMRNLIGNDFQFEASFGNDVKITNISATFKKSFNLENLKSSISILKNRTAANYGQNQ